jgi:small subunit ribosomal protein S17e
MGRIKTSKIKRTAESLVSKLNSRFGTDFAKNKAVLYELNIFNSQRFRNSVAGLITDIMKEKK